MQDHFNAHALSRLPVAQLQGLLARYRDDMQNARNDAERNSAAQKVAAIRLALTLQL